MTEETLVALITLICSGRVSDNSYNAIVKEERIKCWEPYYNCAIKYNKEIMTIQQFNKECLKK